LTVGGCQQETHRRHNIEFLKKVIAKNGKFLKKEDLLPFGLKNRFGN
jgi:hypothetical protein